jgi:hypothetical protein
MIKSDCFCIFAVDMKKLRYIAAVLAVMIALLMSVDESISLYANINTTHIPFHSGNADASHHHTISFGDHFFQRCSISITDPDLSSDLQSFMKLQPEFSYFLSSIWQPPKQSC